MKREILEVLYQKAEAQCHTNEAWVFEEKFAKQVVIETIVVMASACYTQGLQAAITKTCEHFGITND